MKQKIIVRKARSSDNDAVFKFCEKTWDWGDYVPRVWNRWLEEKDGRIFVATINNVPVGISHVKVLKPGEAWLEAARTDPNYRRKGVATAITKECFKFALQKDVKLVRLATNSDNTAALRALRKLGFKLVSEFVKMTCKKMEADKSEKTKWAKVRDEKEIWEFLRKSKCYAKTAGSFTILYVWASLQKEDLKKFLAERKAIICKDQNAVSGLMLIDDGVSREWSENSVQTCYVDGTQEAVLDMIRFLKERCRESGIKRIYGFTCDHKPITSAFDIMGFERDTLTCIHLLEKRLSADEIKCSWVISSEKQLS